MACSGCKKKNNTVSKVVNELPESVQNSTFKLKNNLGVMQINFGAGAFISPDNCDDNLALEFLRANPNRISLFEVYPSNWKELISGVLTIENEKVEPENIEEIKVVDKASKEAIGKSKSK